MDSADKARDPVPLSKAYDDRVPIKASRFSNELVQA